MADNTSELFYLNNVMSLEGKNKNIHSILDCFVDQWREVRNQNLTLNSQDVL